jgi:hypothetical protein
VRNQDLESSLFFLLKGGLIRIKSLDYFLFAARVMRRGYVLENDRHTIVPSSFLGRMVSRTDGADLENTTGFDLLAKNRVVVLFEELNELVGVPPSGFVVIIDHEWLFVGP